MQSVTKLPRRIITTVHGHIEATKTSINIQVQYAYDLLVDMIIMILFMIFSPERFLDRVSEQHDKSPGLIKAELYEAIMYPDDKMELVNVLYDVGTGQWKLDTKPGDKQLGRLVNREDRVLLLCPRKLVKVLAKGRHGESVITVEDPYNKWQTKHVLVNWLSAPGRRDPFGSLPDFGTLVQRGEGHDLRLSSHDIFHIRNLKGFLLHCSKIDNGAPTIAGSILKSWMVTIPQILSIIEDKHTMRKCKTAYWELVRRGRVGLTVYLQLHGCDGDDPDESSQTPAPPDPYIHTTDTRTIADLRLATQTWTVSSGSKTVPNRRSQNERVRIPVTGSKTAGNKEPGEHDVDPYRTGLNINDPQSYFRKFGSLITPQQTTDILLALSFFLRPPELDWENLPFPEIELEKPLPKSRRHTPEVFIASLKPDNRMAPLSEVTRIATTAVQSQFEANGISNDVRLALRSLGETPVQKQLRRTRPMASNDETDTLHSPIYRQEHQRFRSGSPIHIPQAHDNGPGDQGATVTDSTNSTPKASKSWRTASTETTNTVRIHKQSVADSVTASVPNSNGAALNPQAQPFTSLTVPSSGSLTEEGDEELSIPTGELPSISLENSKALGFPGHQQGAARAGPVYTFTNA